MTNPTEFLRIKNWEKYQHYSYRRPPWIKLYWSFLCSPTVYPLSDVCKYHVLAIMSLASQYDNKIPFNRRWISAAIHANSRIKWDEILESGLIECYQDASNVLATCYTRVETEITEKRRVETESALAQVLAPVIVSSLLFDIYQSENKNLPTCLKLTDDRREKCLARLKDNGFAEDFRKAVIKAQGCGFLTGSNDRGWRASFDWLIANGKNVYKVLEGKYDKALDDQFCTED
ncbi:MAG: hypothetical protein V1685_04885 [Parcubacteria group bacterium]